MLRAKYIPALTLFIFSGNSWAGSSESLCLDNNKDYSHILSCYRQKLMSLPLKYNLINKQSLPKVELRHYELISQNWPEEKSALLKWQHKVDIYIPNQYLTLPGNNTLRKEDDAVAYSWSLFLQDPVQNAKIPLHIPMAATFSQAMSLPERELTTGDSERVMCDLPGIRLPLTHIYRSYGNNWPVAFYPYNLQNIDRQIASSRFSRLHNNYRLPEI